MCSELLNAHVADLAFAGDCAKHSAARFGKPRRRERFRAAGESSWRASCGAPEDQREGDQNCRDREYETAASRASAALIVGVIN